MKKPSLIYRCSACGHEEPKWLGRCPECGQWNTMVEVKTVGRFEKDNTAFSVPLESVDPALGARVSSGISELDRVLGGGFMRGSATSSAANRASASARFYRHAPGSARRVRRSISPARSRPRRSGSAQSALGPSRSRWRCSAVTTRTPASR
jgi:hypothetical protein